MDTSQYKTASKQNLCIQLLMQVQQTILARYRQNDKGNAHYYGYYYEIGQLVTQSTCRRGGGVDRYSDDQVHVMLFPYPIILPPASRILSLGNAITLFDCFSKWRLRTCVPGCITCRKARHNHKQCPILDLMTTMRAVFLTFSAL